MTDLPSWVPDWQGVSESQVRRLQGFDNFHASSELEWTTIPVIKSGVLHYMGLSVDIVLGTIVESEKKKNRLQFLLGKIVDALHFKDYPSGLNWFQAWTLVFQGGMAAGLKGNERLDLDSDTFLNMTADDFVHAKEMALGNGTQKTSIKGSH
jgi:hypothetical protein